MPAPAEEAKIIEQMLRNRVSPSVPLLLADSKDDWNGLWRSLKKQRQQRLRDAIERLGVTLAGLRTRAEWIQARDKAIDS